jgi:hypothetical protein
MKVFGRNVIHGSDSPENAGAETHRGDPGAGAPGKKKKLKFF